MELALGLLILPMGISAFVVYRERKAWAWWLLALSLVPPAWAAVLMSMILTDSAEDLSAAAVAVPFVIAAAQLIGMWVAWYRHDPKSAGQALAVTEGIAAAHHAKNKRMGWAAITGAAAVSQWQHSSNLPTGRAPAGKDPKGLPPHMEPVRNQTAEVSQNAGTPPSPPQRDSSSGSEVAKALSQLADLHQQAALTDEEFAVAKQRVLGQRSPEETPATSQWDRQQPIPHRVDDQPPVTEAVISGGQQATAAVESDPVGSRTSDSALSSEGAAASKWTVRSAKWQCPHCSARSGAAAPTCWACQRPRPGNG